MGGLGAPCLGHVTVEEIVVYCTSSPAFTFKTGHISFFNKSTHMHCSKIGAETMQSFKLSKCLSLQLSSPLVPRRKDHLYVSRRTVERAGKQIVHSSADFAVDRISGSARSRSPQPPQVAELKQALLDAISGTQRGSDAGSLKRGSIEEAQVVVEALSPLEVDWTLLEGTWNVIYTTASDVLPLVRPGPGIPGFPLRVGRVGQRFTSPEEGRVQNLIEVEALVPVLRGTKATLVVEASYEVRTSRSIALLFQKAGVGEIMAGDDLQNALASPLLPRGQWNLQALLAITEVRPTLADSVICLSQKYFLS